MAVPVGNRPIVSKAGQLGTREGASIHLKPAGADNSAAVRAAVDSLNSVSAGGEIVLEGSADDWWFAQAGSVTGDGITTPYCVLIDAADAPVTIRGHGMGATRLALAADQPINTSIVLVRGEPAGRRTNPTVLRDLTIDGNGDDQSAEWIDFGLVTAIRCDGFRAERVGVLGTPTADTSPVGDNGGMVIFRDSRSFSVVGCHFVQRVGQGTLLRVESGPGLVDDCDFVGDPEGDEQAALFAFNANTDIGVVAQGVALRGSRFDGGQYQVAVGASKQCLIQGNHFANLVHTAGQSIYLNASTLNGGWWCEDDAVLGNVFYNVRFPVRIQNGSASPAVGVRRILIAGNLAIDGPGVAMGPFVTELGGTNVSDIVSRDNVVWGASTVYAFGAATNSAGLARGTLGYNSSNALVYRDENAGVAVVPSGQTSVVVTHGLGWTPAEGQVQVWPTNSLGNALKGSPGSYTSTQFTLSVDQDPGATTARFGWRASRG